MLHLYGQETRSCKIHDSPSQGEVILRVKTLKLMYFFKNLLQGVVQTNKAYLVMLTKKGPTKFLNFMTPGAGVLVFKSYIVKMHYFFEFLLNSGA